MTTTTNNTNYDNGNCTSDFPPVPQRVVSARLLIRPSNRADASYLKQWWNDPDVTTPGGNVAGMQYDDEDVEDWFQRYVDGRSCSTHFIICLREPVELPIGEFYIASDDRPGSVGVAILIGETGQWGHGYAGEALEAYAEALFESEFCEAIRLDSRRDNERATQMCLHVGFEVEYVWANGQFQTLILTPEAFHLHRLRQSSAQ
jgi:RimJ/RimL family protein N-acetyltransferase